MKKLANIVIGLFIAIVILGIIVPVAGYVMLSTPWWQEHLRAVAQEALQNALGTNVAIEKIEFQPFNRLRILDVTIDDDYGKPSFAIKAIDARVELADFIFSGSMIVDYAVVEELDAKLYRENPDGPSNISRIIDKLSSKEKKESKAKFEFTLDNIQLLRSSISYDVLSLPADSARFSPHHIALSDVNVFVYVPVLSNDEYAVRLKHLNFVDRSGFEVSNVSVGMRLTPTRLMVSDFNLELPNSLLAVGDIDVNIDGIGSVGKVGTVFPVDIEIKEGSHVYLPDLKAFNSELENFDDIFRISMQVGGIADSLCVRSLNVQDASGCMSLGLAGTLLSLSDLKKAKARDTEIDLRLCQAPISTVIRSYGGALSAKARQLIAHAGTVTANMRLDGSLKACRVNARAHTGVGSLGVAGTVGYADGRLKVNATTDLKNIDLGKLSGNADLGRLTAEIDANGLLNGKELAGGLAIDVSKFQFKGYDYSDIAIEANSNATEKSLSIISCDPNADFELSAMLAGGSKRIDDFSLSLDVAALRLDTLGLTGKYPGYALSLSANAQAEGFSLRKFKGDLSVTNASFKDQKGNGVRLNKLNIDADNLHDGIDEIIVSSDIVNGQLQGQYDLMNIWPNIRDLVCEIFPIFAGRLGYYKNTDYDAVNEFAYDFTISNAEQISRFFHLPVTLTDPVSISGELSQARSVFTVYVDAPWLLQGDKAIEATSAFLTIDSEEGFIDAYASTLMPTKKGPMTLVANINAQHNELITTVDWEIDRDIPINGKFEIDTNIRELDDDQLAIAVCFRPGDINFGDEAWKIQSSDIIFTKNHIDVGSFELHCDGQDVVMHGEVGESPDDVLYISLKGLQLINIFETLNIDNALICGQATGDIAVSDLMTKTPNIVSDNLNVQDIGYNYCVLGNSSIHAWLDNEKQAFAFDADIVNPENRVSRIIGSITPATEELDLQFFADRVKVGFMQPFMKAFSSHVSGYASGKAHLFGTFKYIDMEGDIYADSLQIKIDYTNTTYMASDSIHIVPGMIKVDNVRLYDKYGHTADLNGYVKHEFFKSPSFDFKVSNASDFLCYDTKREDNEVWYGRIFGDGSAAIKGYPGMVNIGANMTTGPNSIFTFELSDMEVAEEYQFITFRDKTPQPVVVDSILEIFVPARAKQIADGMALDNDEEDLPTDLMLDLNVDITPDARVEIVIDPIGRDKISCTGNGHMRLTYNSSDNSIGLLGEYVLQQGKYGFTLQDIIYRDFQIAANSKITFTGDPYDGNLDIKATYGVNANLSDLDESFLNDKELNRTNVPVNAVMYVTGKMTQPDIAFDLEFPTLSTDVDRKVHSIVSTDDMMNMQIIYLLALNRFYTPDYMATTKGNELFSVASSTISSQLSSILGKLSDNWSIAPNLRSDRGDFSDLEVDVTLRSNLLNNRLLLNGNLGYRDKSLNTNQFIGDFDIEYLLNRPGTLRLKAYNRYNDQNYYLRTAQTTQGIGVVMKRDFDNIFPLFHRKKEEAKPDSAAAMPDSIHVIAQ